ncbi:MAG: hypothetical protein L6R39_001389 [Caloplaca ligustica]|nr:MAG: hypothetical protein L6R39_001389 [Caloplaca ligustica]
MGLRRGIQFLPVLAVIATLAAASPYPPSKASDYVDRRDTPDIWATGGPGWCFNNPDECPGIYPEAYAVQTPVCQSINDAINDVSFLAHAALRALYNSNATNIAPSAPITGKLNPAPHFFYFFDNDVKVAKFVADVFAGIAACADHHDCPFSLVFCGEGAWPGSCNPGRYGFVRDPNQLGATRNNQPKGGGVVHICEAGLALPRNPTPCTTGTGGDYLGFALLTQLVQVDVITRPDTTFLQSKTGNTTITEFHYDGAPWTLKELGYGTAGNGLRTRGLEEAWSWAKFASLSWDLGFGGSPWTGETCLNKWDDVVRTQQLLPLNG